MLSRVAESIYWMSRYSERAENVARVIDVNLQLMLDAPDSMDQQWKPLVSTAADETTFVERFGEASQDNVVKFLTFDAKNPNSILSCVRSARENARSIREVISSEMWLQLNQFYLLVNSAARNSRRGMPSPEFFAEVKQASQAFTGLNNGTMTHGEGWHFSRLGRMLERADQTSRILDVKYFILLRSVEDVGTPYDDLQWAAVLRSASAFEMFRQGHGRITPRGVVEFLMLDRDFPRAVRYCVLRAQDSLHRISGTAHGTFSNKPEKVLGQLSSELSFVTVDDLISAGLHEFVDELQGKLNRAADTISETFFAARIPASTKRRLRPAAR